MPGCLFGARSDHLVAVIKFEPHYITSVRESGTSLEGHERSPSTIVANFMEMLLYCKSACMHAAQREASLRCESLAHTHSLTIYRAGPGTGGRTGGKGGGGERGWWDVVSRQVVIAIFHGRTLTFLRSVMVSAASKGINVPLVASHEL